MLNAIRFGHTKTLFQIHEIQNINRHRPYRDLAMGGVLWERSTCLRRTLPVIIHGRELEGNSKFSEVAISAAGAGCGAERMSWVCSLPPSPLIRLLIRIGWSSVLKQCPSIPMRRSEKMRKSNSKKVIKGMLMGAVIFTIETPWKLFPTIDTLTGHRQHLCPASPL